ncbi:MAG: hypothetical protein L6R35_006312 [Caloplaca aegaea]|nr:MAG: hypothetical protein L6R35_006312 [Caloplaca aegaea]
MSVTKLGSRFDQVDARFGQVDVGFGKVDQEILEIGRRHIEENQIELRNLLMPGWTEQGHDSELASYQSRLEKEFAIIPSLIKQLRGQRHQLIFSLIEQRQWMQEEVPMEKIITNITFQLLQRWSEDVHDWKQFNEVQQELKNHTWAEDFVSLRRVLVILLEQFEETTIILDRIDRAKRTQKMIKALIPILSESRRIARILLVTKQPASTAMEWEYDISAEVKQKVTYLQIDGWHQEQDEQSRTSRRRRRH